MSSVQPIRYSPSLEKLLPDEEKTAKELRDTLHGILETTSKDYKHAPRSVHAKGHALVRGTMTVKEGLPTELAQGLFSRAGDYDVLLRISTSPGDILDDSVTAPRGIAMKVLGVEGEHEESNETTTQDFIMVDGPVFTAPNADKFLGNLKMLAATTDKVEGLKKVMSAMLRATEAGLEAVGLESAAVKSMGGAPSTHPLGQTYFTQTAYRYGDHVAKLSLQPRSKNLTELADETVSISDRPDALREVCAEVFAVNPCEWALRVQLCIDPEAMPIEDPTVEWDQAKSPYVEVARVRVEPQPSWEHGMSERAEDELSFAPWHCLSAHRPLGNINRARRGAYEMSADFRSKFNGCPLHEPRVADATV